MRQDGVPLKLAGAPSAALKAKQPQQTLYAKQKMPQTPP